MDGAARAVLVRDGRAEERHHAVARVLVDRALEAVDLGGDGLEAAIDDLVDVLGVAPLGQAREPGDVGEEHGDLAALALDGRARLEHLVGEVLRRVGGDRPRAGERARRRRWRRRPAARPGRGTARAGVRTRRRSARRGAARWRMRAAGLEGFAALVAEAVGGGVVGLAGRALHRPRLPGRDSTRGPRFSRRRLWVLFGSRSEQLPG